MTKEIRNYQNKLYVRYKFVRHQAAGLYYISWTAKKSLPKIIIQVYLPKTAENCTARTANWTKLPKK